MARWRGSGIARASWQLMAGLGLSLAGATVLAGEVRVQVLDADGEPVEKAAVVVRAIDALPERLAAGQAVIDQVDQEFVPSAIAVPVNTRILFPNNDDIRHHVYSFSEAKSFELPLYEGEPPRPIEFPNPGIVTIGCNIHDWMRAHIYVVDSPWYGLTDGNGAWRVSGLPAGEYQYRVEVWHHGLAEERQTVGEVGLERGGAAEVQAVVEIEAAPVPRRTPRRDRYRRYP